jgi:hypothetical protein
MAGVNYRAEPFLEIDGQKTPQKINGRHSSNLG